ncbi:MAG: cobalamin biosynthesis protein [Methanothrix sp.]|nr:cobalamin biosynthesis protein [Methanothrix sp.]
MIIEALAVFLLAAAYDILLGEPPAKVHPVVWIGKLISFLRAKVPATKAGGIALALMVIAATLLAGHLLVLAAGVVPILPLLASAFLLKSTFAIRCLLEVSGDIGEMIERDFDEARKMLPALVGRDTASLTKSQASSAVIESLSENYVDSILSPIFYYVLFSPFGLGLEAALAFKAVSTMDSMLGYKTRGLKEIGFAGARADDLLNFIPARLSLIPIALARPSRASAAIRAAFRYHARTPSPNSGWPMAALAGAMNIRLEKPGYYVLQDEGDEPRTADVQRALRIMQAAIAITLAGALLIMFFWQIESGSIAY